MEAALTLPVFLIAVITLNSIILMYACIEDCNFIIANELRRAAAEASVADTSVTVPYRVRRATEDKHSQIKSEKLMDACFRTSRWGIDELLAVDYRLRLKANDPLGMKASADYELSFVTRAYVGRERDGPAMSADEFADNDARAVYIFPKRGERYHSEGCTFLKAACRSGPLTESIRKRYKACPLCHSSNAGAGALVYYFPSDGEDYHLRGCPSLQRNYIEIDLDTAVERGYTPCGKCGG